MNWRSMVSVAAASVATAAFADTTAIVNTFESDKGAWSGAGELTTEEVDEPGYGFPTTADHTQTLAVAGTVTCSTTDVSDANVIDMMVKVTRPDETPEATDYNSDSTQFAIYSDENGNLKLYCKETSGGSATSVDLGNFDANAWLRLTIAVDYNKNSLVVATNGVLTASTYYLANEPQSQAVTNVNVIGTTAIDDFVAKNGSFEPYAQVATDGSAATTDGLPKAYMTKYSMSDADQTIPNSNPTMTVQEAYLAGIPPTEGATFAIEEASYDGDNLTLTFPGEWPAGSYTVKYGSTADCNDIATPTTVAKTGSGNQVTIPLKFGSGNVLYYKVER